MTHFRPFLVALAATATLLPLPSARAAVVATGNVTPVNPATWGSSTAPYIGRTSDGSLTIDQGSDVLSSYVFLGHNAGCTGTATVTGAGSTWTSSASFYVGRDGSGTLRVDNGGKVTAKALFASLGDLSGNGTITVCGAVLNTDVVFDATHGVQQTLAFGSGGILNLNVDGTGQMGAGYKGSGTLRIADGKTVASTAGYLGYIAGSSGAATIRGAASTWNNSGYLEIGTYGSGTLNIEAGGRVSNSTGYLGHEAGSSGTAIVSGSGAKWTNSSSLYVGSAGRGTLTIEAGGEVSNTFGYLGMNSDSTGTVTVAGAGSKWTNNGPLYVGYYGNGTLSVAAGAVVTSQESYLAGLPYTTAVVSVDGVGSTWTAGNLYVGNSGSGTLNITAGGTVNSQAGSLGLNSGATGVATVAGMGSTWTLSEGLSIYRNGTLNINGGAVVATGRTSVEYGTDTGTVNFGPGGGTLTTASLAAGPSQLTGTGVVNARGMVSDVDLVFDSTASLTRTLTFATAPGQNITVNLDMASDPSKNGDLGVGYTGNGSLVIRDGITVNSQAATLGRYSGATATATVAGNGTAWTNTADLSLGRSGSATLSIANGAAVSNANGFIASSTGGSGTVNVEGAGSTWTNSGSLSIGSVGQGSLNISQGGVVVVGGATTVGSNGGNGSITFGPGGGTVTTRTLMASPNQLAGTGTINARGLVSDVDLVFDSLAGLKRTITLQSKPDQNITLNLDMQSDLSQNGDLGAGWNSNALLTIHNGVAVNSKDGVLGYVSGAHGAAVVTGAGSKWSNAGTLFVGRYGNGTLQVESRGTVESAGGSIGDYAGSTGVVTIDGPEAKWTTTGGLTVGRDGNGTLRIVSGGTASSGNGSIAANSGATGTVMIDGANSKWSSTTFYVGYGGHGNLSITAGGSLTHSSVGAIGEGIGSRGMMTVDGIGSSWSSGSRISIGSQGQGSLYISHGGTVSNIERASIAYHPGSTGVVTVDGPGSKWEDRGELIVGRSGAGTLNIVDGGTVTSYATYVGYDAGSTGIVNIRGSGSQLINIANGYYVGWFGNGILNIDAGGTATTATNGSIIIGDRAGSIGAVNVRGHGSTWATRLMTIGNSGNGKLTITDGGSVSCSGDDIYLGNNANSIGLVTVAGAGSIWSNNATNSELYVGWLGRGMLTIADGGEVTAHRVLIYNESVVAIDVANGSKLTLNSGNVNIIGAGKVRLLAGAGASAGVAYTPISAGNYGSSGYQAVGGTWDAAGHTFTPAAIEEVAAGTALTLDLAVKQRAKISDSATDWALGESFLAKSATLSVTTTAISGTTRTSLEPLIAADQSLRGGWQFTTDSGYAAGEPAYLSFDLGAGYARSALSVWRYSGSAWASYDAVDLTYNGRYGSFTVTDLNTAGYAMAGTLTRAWTGGAMGDDWSQGANWNNGVACMPTDIVVFDGTTRLTPNNESAGRQVAGLKFAASAGEFHLNGNALKLAGKIDDQAAAKQEINLPVEFVAGPESGTVNVTSGGELKISQPVGGNQGLTKTGAGTLQLLQDIEYTGNTDVQAGTLVVQGLSNSGSTTVSGTLVADYVRQDTLTINAGGKVEIDAAGTSVVSFLSIADGSGGFAWETATSATELPPTAIGEGIRLPQSAAGVASHNSEPVPEPAAWWLCAAAAAVVVLTLRREGMHHGGA